MTDTTNTMPPLPVHPYGQALWTWSASERRAIIAYGDARAAHAVAQVKARIAELEAENFKLSAMACPLGFGDEGGTPRCCAEARIDELKVELNKLLQEEAQTAVDEELAYQKRARRESVLAQIKAREVTDAEIDALLLDAIGFDRELGYFRREDVRHIVRAAIALANGRG